MKRYSYLIISILISFLGQSAYCQTTGEWFDQKNTQLKYSALMIAKLQMYLSYVKKGYQVVNEGLTLVGDIKDADFKLHNVFFNDLQLVKPVIKNSETANEIKNLVVTIRSQASKTNSFVEESNGFVATEKEFIRLQINHLLDALLLDISSFNDVLSNGNLELSDIERLKRIEKIAIAVRGKAKWIKKLDTTCNLIAHQRLNSSNDLNYLLDLNK